MQTFANESDIDTSFHSSGAWLDGVATYSEIQADGKLLVGGTFLSYSWISARWIIRFNADGTKDTWFTIWSWFNNFVLCIYSQANDKILVGWQFTWYNWAPANYLARLNADGSRDTGFDIWSGFNSDIRFVIPQSDGNFFVWGAFTSYQWVSANRLIRLHADWSRDTSFDIWSGFNDNVNSMIIQADWKIVVAGKFTSYQGITANKLIRLNADGSRDSSFDAWLWLDLLINDILFQPDGKILVAWSFTTYQWVSANRIVRLNSDGSRDSSFDIWSGFNSIVVSIYLLPYGQILAAGWFTSYQWVSANRLIRLNADGSRDTSFDIWVGFDVTVRYINMQPDGKIVLCGTFSNYQWISATRITRLYGYDDIIILPNSTDTTTIKNAFTNKWYIQTNGTFIWSKSISLWETNGNIPTPLHIENQNISLFLPSNIQFKQTDSITNYTGILAPPTTTSVVMVNGQDVLSSFAIGSDSTSIQLTWGVATLSVPLPGKSIGDFIQIYSSDDNGGSWLPHTKTWVTNNNGQPYVTFTTNHFTDFAFTVGVDNFTWTFSIDNDAVSTTSSGVTLNMSTTPTASKMRFSNDNVTRTLWENYASTTSRTLPGSYGSKTVYAQFDADGDWTGDVTTSDDISYVEWSNNNGGKGSTWNLRLEITTTSWTCTYGTSLFIGSHASQFAAYDMTGANFSSSFSCIDTEGLSDWTMTMQASTDLSNGSQSIPKANVSLLASTNYLANGSCSTGTNQIDWAEIGTNPWTIINKMGNHGDICTLTTDTVNLAVRIPAAQAVGLYTGTLMLNMPF